MREIRAGCDPAWGIRLAGHVLNRCPLLPGAVVSGFWPLPGEIDIRPLLLALAGRGHVVALPETPARGQRLIFHRWRCGGRMIPERFGTFRPEPDPVTPDLLFVPLLAFDRRGHRLGYGAGYYDRTLAELTGSRAIGCAFAAQEVALVPVEAHDRPLDAVATEEGVLLTE
jgi:5-formyltetrahydrofolate cyclo-ligase